MSWASEAFLQTLAESCWLQKPLLDPASAADPTRSECSFSCIDVLADQKIIENNSSQTTFKKLKDLTPLVWDPFWLPFWDPLAHLGTLLARVQSLGAPGWIHLGRFRFLVDSIFLLVSGTVPLASHIPLRARSGAMT